MVATDTVHVALTAILRGNITVVQCHIREGGQEDTLSCNTTSPCLDTPTLPSINCDTQVHIQSDSSPRSTEDSLHLQLLKLDR